MNNKLIIILKLYSQGENNNNNCESKFLSDYWNFFSWSESIGDTFNIKNKGDTSKNPFLGR
jgi:hypothetical protein